MLPGLVGKVTGGLLGLAGSGAGAARLLMVPDLLAGAGAPLCSRQEPRRVARSQEEQCTDVKKTLSARTLPAVIC